MKNFTWLIILSLCGNLIDCFDLGPIIRIAQCRSQCLKKYSVDGVCGSFRSDCKKCWRICEDAEKQWKFTSETVCEKISTGYIDCPGCQTACTYRQTRVEEEYLPSMLPAPKKGPAILDELDVAVVMVKEREHWKELNSFPGSRISNVLLNNWIIVVSEQGISQYSSLEWVPTVESLKKGLLYEVTLSWPNLSSQLQKQQDLEQSKMNDKIRQLFLEKYGEKVLTEWKGQEDSQITEAIFRRFFFRRKEEDNNDEVLDDLSTNTNSFEIDESLSEKQPYIVSWEPETGGLTGNQVAETNSAQISLYPGTKYLVRILSNVGPSSFPIEIDTRTNSTQVKRVKINTFYYCFYYYLWDISFIFFAVVFACFVISMILKKRNKKVIIEKV